MTIYLSNWSPNFVSMFTFLFTSLIHLLILAPLMNKTRPKALKTVRAEAKQSRLDKTSNIFSFSEVYPF